MKIIDSQPDNLRINPLFSLRNKLAAMLVLASLAAALAVGGTAYWMLMQDFNATVRANAFAHFEADVQAYIGEYGSWDKARHKETFREFVLRNRGVPGQRMLPGGRARPPEQDAMEEGDPPLAGTPKSAIPRRDPPFRFMLLDTNGHVLIGDESRVGHTVGEAILADALPISVNGKVEVLAVPVGTPQLSMQDKAYIDIMRKALLRGLLAAGILAAVLGWLLGSRFGARVRELISAIQSMRTDGELLQKVPVHTRDEMGLLATAFNRMSSELSQAHSALQATNEQVQLQAAQLKELSIRDPLTKMFNRRYFDEQSKLMYEQAIRHDRAFSVMVGDLDHFKLINDNFSHAIGDEVLRRVALILRKNTRGTDVVARYGGEEFAIAFVESTAQQAAMRCEVLRHAIEQYAWHEVHPDLRVTMSMGLCDDTKRGSVEKMLAVADEWLYEAKRGGRNRVVAN